VWQATRRGHGFRIHTKTTHDNRAAAQLRPVLWCRVGISPDTFAKVVLRRPHLPCVRHPRQGPDG